MPIDRRVVRVALLAAGPNAQGEFTVGNFTPCGHSKCWNREKFSGAAAFAFCGDHDISLFWNWPNQQDAATLASYTNWGPALAISTIPDRQVTPAQKVLDTFLRKFLLKGRDGEPVNVYHGQDHRMPAWCVEVEAIPTEMLQGAVYGCLLGAYGLRELPRVLFLDEAAMEQPYYGTAPNAPTEPRPNYRGAMGRAIKALQRIAPVVGNTDGNTNHPDLAYRYEEHVLDVSVFLQSQPTHLPILKNKARDSILVPPSWDGPFGVMVSRSGGVACRAALV